jgi:asparagine synthase (glutamine-hydrolysing)
VASLDRLSGCFVIVIAWPSSGRVVVYRDRLGGRTAYWHRDNQRILLSSSAGMIAGALGRVSLDREWLAHWFGLGWPALPALTPFSSIRELLPGEQLEIADRRIHRHRAPFKMPVSAQARSSSEWLALFNSTFTDSVHACLDPEGSTALMLSGGLDSGPTAVVAANLLSGERRSLTAVSWSLPSIPDADESERIQGLAAALDLRCESFDGGDYVPYRRLTTDLVVADFPTFNFYREIILLCYEHAARLGISVILNAARGDLIYPPGNMRLADLWARGERGAFLSSLLRRFQILGWSGTWRDPSFRYWLRRLIQPLWSRRQSPPKWLAHSALVHLPEVDLWPVEVKQHPLPQYAARLIGSAMAWGTAHENLFSQRFGVERRDPFQNEALVRLMLQMPVSMSVRDGTDKWIMREAMRGRMPERFRIVGRTGLLNGFLRLGFEQNREHLRRFLFSKNTDWQAWVRPEFVGAVLDDRDVSEQGQMILGKCVGYSLWLKRLEIEGISVI